MSEFKNLPSGWSRYELGEICKISSSKFDPTKNSEVKKCIELEHLSQKTGQILGFISSSEQKSIKNEFKTGQILYGKLRPYLQKFCQAKFDGVCSSEIWVLQGKKSLTTFYFIWFSQINLIKSQIKHLGQKCCAQIGNICPRCRFLYLLN